MDALDDAERDALRRVAYEEERVTTDLRPATLERKVETLRPRLVEVAGDGETTSYRSISGGFSLVHWSRVGAVLGIIGLLEDAMGRPLLPAVVVKADTGIPGDGYFRMVEAVDGVDQAVPDDRRGRRALWSTQVLSVWQHY